jgi:uncharacterized protein
MKRISCPVCNAPFQEVVRDQILIDVCTQCRGVWLDRGELEKLLQAVREAGGPHEAPRANTPRRHASPLDDDDRPDSHRPYEEAGRHPYAPPPGYPHGHGYGYPYGHPYGYGYGKYRKKSKLEILMGIFD